MRHGVVSVKRDSVRPVANPFPLLLSVSDLSLSPLTWFRLSNNAETLSEREAQRASLAASSSSLSGAVLEAARSRPFSVSRGVRAVRQALTRQTRHTDRRQIYRV